MVGQKPDGDTTIEIRLLIADFTRMCSRGNVYVCVQKNLIGCLTF